MSWFTEMDVVLVAAASTGWNLKASLENITKKDAINWLRETSSEVPFDL